MQTVYTTEFIMTVTTFLIRRTAMKRTIYSHLKKRTFYIV
jgi:hypothetical protein